MAARVTSARPMQPKRLTMVHFGCTLLKTRAQVRCERKRMQQRRASLCTDPVSTCLPVLCDEYQAVIALVSALGVTHTRASKAPVAPTVHSRC
jgi:hypothetical protein